MNRWLFYAVLACLVLGILAGLVSNNLGAAGFAALAAGFFWTGEYYRRALMRAEQEVADMKQVLHAALRHADSPLTERE